MDDNKQADTQVDDNVKQDVSLLVEQNRQIVEELKALNDHKLIRVYNSLPKLVAFNLLKGIALGLGSVLGATVVLSTLVYILSQFEFIPVIGDWVSEIIKVVKSES